MDAAQALADLTQASTQIEGAVIAEARGSVLASTWDDARGKRVADAALGLLEAAGEARAQSAELTQVLAETADGGVFVVRDGSRVVAAVTARDPIAGLIFYDLKTCLRLLENDESAKAKKPPAARKKPATKEADA